MLVLDDFERNLETGGSAFLDPDGGAILCALAGSARRGRLLVTCRHPVPGVESLLHRVPVGPLSPAEGRKLLLRLSALRDSLNEAGSEAKIMRVVGGHPRMLEFLDALLRGGEGRLSHVTLKLRNLVAEHGLDLETAGDRLEESLHAALIIGMRDILLDELLDLTCSDGIDEALLQAATSNLPVTPAGLARMLVFNSADSDDSGDEGSAERALARLADLSLVHRFPNGSAWVHRWTAEGLACLDEDVHRKRCVRAGCYRRWRCRHESHALEDAVESVRNFLVGGDYDAAVAGAGDCVAVLDRFQKLMTIAAFTSEVLEILPETHPGFAPLADQEAQAHLALGNTDSAQRRYTRLLARYERLAQAEPDRADYQRDLSVSLVKVGSGDDPSGVVHLERALTILESLKDTGRLEPVDEPMIPELKRMLHDRGLKTRD